ncbi:MAG: S41 family peptidase [Candidatus Wildermuthbacteria bacterium]|nr:S41 family peptidase [Candidatus Wildermuthbacteria bacterium]
MERERVRKYGLLICGIALVTAFFLGVSLGKGQALIVPIAGVSSLELGQPAGADFSLFWDTWRVVQEKYAKSGDLNSQAMVYGAIAGMVESLDDPYTVFMDPEETKRFQEDIEGSFEGVGMEIGIKEKTLKVVAPLEGTPAQKAGLLPGDSILKIGEEFTKDMSLDQAILLIRGPKGTEVTLSVARESWKEPKDISITRDLIQVPSLKWEMKDGDVAYVKLYQFSRQAGSAFSGTAQEILRSKAKSIILDLRGNPGGYLDVSVDIAGWFLERGQTVVIEDFGKEGREKAYEARGNGRLGDYPVVVLMNEGSASASEILAGALRDQKGITLIGDKSFGKGSVQEVEDLRGGSSLKVTVANWLTPNRSLITGVGLDPDIAVEMTSDDYEAKRDPQLDAALEFVRNL